MDESLFSEMHEAIDKLFSHETVNKEDIVSLQESIFTHIIPQFNEAIVLTDILGVSRNNLFNSINNGLVDKIKQEIEHKSEKLDEKRQQKLWNKLMRSGHKYIHHPIMQPLLMHVMGKMNSVKELYVSEILKSKDLYDKTPMDVLRHVWMDNPRKLKEEIDQIVDNYVSSVIKKLHIQAEDAINQLLKQRRKYYGNLSISLVPYIHTNIKSRKTDDNIQKLVDMIGDSKSVCSNIIQTIQDKFTEGHLKKENALIITSISTINFDLYSRLIDKHLSSRLFDNDDDLHNMISLFSSCIRENTIDNRASLHISNQLKDRQHLTKELELVFMEPFVLHILAQTIISLTVDAANNKKLPRENLKIQLLSCLISYGLYEFDPEARIDRTQSSALSSTRVSTTTTTISTSTTSISGSRKRAHKDDHETINEQEVDVKKPSYPQEIVESIVLQILPAIQQTHVSASRDKLAKQKLKIQASMLTRQFSGTDPHANRHSLVPTQYLSSPLGRLFIQYHCLWCLQKKEYFILRLLLVAISNSRRGEHRPSIEWRPELLQSLVFGICSLQSTNEKMMIDFLNLLRPAIPMTTVFFQLLFLVTLAALKDLNEVEKLIDVFIKHPGTDIENTNLPSGKSYSDLLESLHSTNKDGTHPNLGNATPLPGNMMTPSSPRVSYPFSPLSPSIRPTPLSRPTPNHPSSSSSTSSSSPFIFDLPSTPSSSSLSPASPMNIQKQFPY